MILSVSRRTDIPARFADWFLNRISEGYVYVRNPMNARQVSRIDLSPGVVDCIVFWTKNPVPMMERLSGLQAYPYYFQFTLTGYGRDMEPGLPDKRKELIPAFQRLSRQIGKRRVIWRYDPIFLSPAYTIEFHLKTFEEYAAALEGCTDTVMISFVDLYAKTKRNTAGLSIRAIPEREIMPFAGELAGIAARHGMKVESCAEKLDLRPAGIEHGCCIDRRRIEEIVGCDMPVKKDKAQRQECGCVESMDIGAYHTCPNGCRYCYANAGDTQVREHLALYDPAASILCGRLGPEDKITERKVKSLKDGQMSIDKIVNPLYDRR